MTKNQRILKFRAWDICNKNMETNPYAWINDGEINTAFADEDFVFMQFTGLLDKNGKEIYEGDIIHQMFMVKISEKNIEDFRNYYKKDFVVGSMFDDGPTSEVVWLGKEAKFSFGKTGMFHEWNKIEVIGDIYTTPYTLTAAEEDESADMNGVAL